MYCGTSNIVLPVRNKSEYPEAYRDKSRLQFYASVFNSLEVNSTFYKLPRASTVVNWAMQVPEHFRFTVKLAKLITHQKQLAFDPAYLVQFMTVMRGFGSRKGCLLVQFPAGTKCDCRDRFALLLELLSAENDGWRIAVEFRDTRWYNPEIFALLHRFNCCLVEHDMPRSAPAATTISGPMRFLRFHGPAGDYRGTYSATFLAQLAGRVRKSEQNGSTVYVYFNNTMGQAVHNALTLQQVYGEIAPVRWRSPRTCAIEGEGSCER